MAALIRQGELCRSCSDGKCRSLGTEQEPIAIECPGCSGEGCEHCDDGNVNVAGCPNRYCREVSQVVRLGYLFAKGLPPVAGGVLDQSAWFIQAVGILQRDEEQIKHDRDSK